MSRAEDAGRLVNAADIRSAVYVIARFFDLRHDSYLRILHLEPASIAGRLFHLLKEEKL